MQPAAGSESLVPVNSQLQIREGSFIARIAAKKLGCNQVAIVIGQTIHLHHTSTHEFLANKGWVRHEMMHLQQFRRYGTLKFIFLYLLESIRNGYYNNCFEIEARQAESIEPIQLHQN
jgi:hypothetical protein